jgi:hypothetical protein
VHDKLHLCNILGNCNIWLTLSVSVINCVMPV